MEAALLHCPIRGGLRVRQRASDGLTFTEEKHRIDAIRYLLQRRYPRDNFGIEPTLFKLGRDGRNSFRTDFAIYDCPYDDIRGKPHERRLEHLRVLAEIKRDNGSAEQAKATQVRSALNMVPDIDTLGVYWDDIEQRFFYRQMQGKSWTVHEAPISKIPAWGASVGSTQLSYRDLDAAKDLVRIFDEIEIALHPYIADKVGRYYLIQQLLLAKIHDENRHRIERKQDTPLDFQDFSAAAISDAEVLQRMNAALSKAAGHYNVYLPATKTIESEFYCPPEVLRNVSRILAPVNILSSKTQVIQSFYMKFAKSLYKWDLAQYFTPHEVIDFIVDAVNPQAGEHIHDPACGSADFLISAFRKAGPTAENCVWGADNSEQAVQISILNMVLNGDGKTQIDHVDSLSSFSETTSKSFDVVLCNPPFGKKIVERRFEVLRKFSMGSRWERDELNRLRDTQEVRSSQQTGILFAELCLRLAKPGGRVAIILPNGYLENRGVEYQALRHWLLCQGRLVAVVGFPRFTFKKSGADVSASVLIMEKRANALKSVADDLDYQFFSGNLESVGWRAGDKKAVPLFVRNPETGELVLDDNNEPILDADFDEVLFNFLACPAPDLFPWVIEDRERPSGIQQQAISIEEVISRADLSLSPKLFSSKLRLLRSQIESGPHISFADVFRQADAASFRAHKSNTYSYVDIERIGYGEFDTTEMRGWQLPARARLPAQKGDLFIPHIWSSVGKWFIAPEKSESLVVTNGCTRLQLIEGAERFVPSILIGLCSEAFRVQMRAFATGSDGLAEISTQDILNVVFPIVDDAQTVEAITAHYRAMLDGNTRFATMTERIIGLLGETYPVPPRRKSHCALI